MKKWLKTISVGVAFAFLGALAVTMVTDTNVAYAAYRCSKCGKGTSASDPYMGNQDCPKGGTHSWYYK